MTTPRLDSYLIFDGNCAEAMRFYQKTLGGKLTYMMTHEEVPGMTPPPGMEKRIMHARLDLGGRQLMASDNMIGSPYAGIQNAHMSLIYDTPAEAKKVFDALAEGGQVNMPFQDTFWAEGFGMLKDRFGTQWMVNGGEKAFGGK